MGDNATDSATMFFRTLTWVIRAQAKTTPFVSAFALTILLTATTCYSESYSFSTPVGGTGGSSDGTNAGASLTAPTAISVANGTNIFFTDGNCIRKLTQFGTNWVVKTIAGILGYHAADDGTNFNAHFNFPNGLCADASGNLFVADTANDTIRKVSLLGTNWVTTTICGAAMQQGTANGSNNVARFNQPYGIAIDGSGNLFVADTVNQTIRKITVSGTNWVVTTLAGLPGTSGVADGTNTDARFNSPAALAVDASGNIYVADLGNETIRKVAPVGTNWVVTTLCGLAGAPGSADGSNNVARFVQPQGITIDNAGRLVVADGANTIRRIKSVGTNWVVKTVAGVAGQAGLQDGYGTNARFNAPTGIAADPSGAVLVTDYLNYAIRLGRIAAVLDYTRAGSQLTLSWPTNFADYTLEAKGSVTGLGSWVPITSGIVTNGDTVSYTTGTSGPPTFYRLRH